MNACKLPTQQFFNEEMGVPMRMLPDYETLECRFQFGVSPTLDDERDVRSVPCFAACPSSGLLRAQLATCHAMGDAVAPASGAGNEGAALAAGSSRKANDEQPRVGRLAAGALGLASAQLNATGTAAVQSLLRARQAVTGRGE